MGSFDTNLTLQDDIINANVFCFLNGKDLANVAVLNNKFHTIIVNIKLSVNFYFCVIDVIIYILVVVLIENAKNLMHCGKKHTLIKQC